MQRYLLGISKDDHLHKKYGDYDLLCIILEMFRSVFLID